MKLLNIFKRKPKTLNEKHSILKKYNSKLINGLREINYNTLIFELEETERRLGLAPENKKLTFININSLINKLDYSYNIKKDIELICEYYLKAYKNNENYIKMLKYDIYCKAVYEKLKQKEISAYTFIFEDETIVFSYARVENYREGLGNKEITQAIKIHQCNYKELDLENYIENIKEEDIFQVIDISNTNVFRIKLNKKLVEASTLMCLDYDASKYLLLKIQDNKNLTSVQSKNSEILQNIMGSHLENLMKNNPNLGVIPSETCLNNWLIVNILEILKTNKLKATELNSQNIIFILNSQKENSTAYNSYIKESLFGGLEEYRRIGYIVKISSKTHKVYVIAENFYIEIPGINKNSLIKVKASDKDFEEIKEKIIKAVKS